VFTGTGEDGVQFLSPCRPLTQMHDSGHLLHVCMADCSLKLARYSAIWRPQLTIKIFFTTSNLNGTVWPNCADVPLMNYSLTHPDTHPSTNQARRRVTTLFQDQHVTAEPGHHHVSSSNTESPSVISRGTRNVCFLASFLCSLACHRIQHALAALWVGFSAVTWSCGFK